ncbi:MULTISPECIES: hypothetical protein [Xanthomonas]|uniref:Restriction system protein Mrr-like N-terminal domain-containing protein n=1 Tax=Xanthomonas indica TaxID=2912242 RepID=A0AAU8I9Q6_9XANT|nr:MULTISPECIES: hypothetical protein [Xanthomonas]MCI2262462.1 hypothetical protein [Xanthomonas indica]
MAKREDLQDWVVAALKAHAGSASIVQVAQHIWTHHEKELHASGELFFTWQYDMRWACTRLRERKIVQSAEVSKRGEWRLAS